MTALLDLVAEGAVLADRAAVTGLVGVVVASETARRVDVADLGAVGAPGHVHLRKDVLIVESSGRGDRLRDVAIRAMVEVRKMSRDPGVRGGGRRGGGGQAGDPLA